MGDPPRTDQQGKSNAGQYYRPMPLDFLLLEKMPEKGLLGGVHWQGRRAKDLRAEIMEGLDNGAVVEVTTISARLRSMKIVGLIEDFPAAGAGGTAIWARTPAGTEFLATKEEVLGA